MDKIRIPKVPNVACTKRGRTNNGCLHLTAHHLIFCADDDGAAANANPQTESKENEIWIPYPLISLVTRLPLTLQGHAPINIQTRTFGAYTFTFKADDDAGDVWESVRNLTVVTTINQLYAFYYAPSPPLPHSSSLDPQSCWRIFVPRAEFSRMGLGSRTRGWRFTDVNKDYSLCPTYPSLLCVPTRISDATLTYAAKYRTKFRIPALSYLHWNLGTITRSSQPMIGLTNNRSIQDEKLVESIFTSSHPSNVRISLTSASPASSNQGSPVLPQVQLYGATTTSVIIDSRPTANAFANAAKGGGSENMDYYKEGKKAYVPIDNIHTMRDALNKIGEVLREGELLEEMSSGEMTGGWLDRATLRRSGWLRHLGVILEGTLLITKTVHVQASHVLIHCSDGWDRTSQLSSLAQVCLDPYYRTMKGFAVLVEKDWAYFGHMFCTRLGHLTSEKIFVAPPANAGGGAEILAAVQSKLGGGGSHLKETSPVFHQFLECTWNIMLQFPERFEFTAEFLQELFYQAHACQFGTFLFNCERERVAALATEQGKHLTSVWDYLFSDGQRQRFINSSYDSSLDEHGRKEQDGRWGDMGVLLVNPRSVKFWAALYGRKDEEMNVKISQAARLPEVHVTGATESDIDDSGLVPIISSASSSGTPSRPQSTPPTAANMTPPRSTSSPSPFSRSVPGVGDVPTTVNAGLLTSTSDPGALSPTGTQGRHRKEDTFRPFPVESQSAFSMQTHKGDTANSNAASSSLGTQASLDTRMKSMWGKLSSNAANAFTAVQDAYGGVAREFQGLSTQAPSNERELTEGYNTYGVGRREESSTYSRASARPGYSIPVEDNPWATTSQRPSVSRVAVEEVFPRNREVLISASPSSTYRQEPEQKSVAEIASTRDPTVPDVLNPWSSPPSSGFKPSLPNNYAARAVTSSAAATAAPSVADSAASGFVAIEKLDGPSTDPFGIANL